jgi:hypothetical protein
MKAEISIHLFGPKHLEDRILQDSDGCKETRTMKQSKIDGNPLL